MYKEIERQFKEQVDVEDLETKKKRLQLIRDMHRPLDHQELSQHAMKVQELLKHQEDERNQKQLKVKAEIRGMHQKLGQLKSGVMEQVLENDKKMKIDEVEKEKAQKELIMKQKMFAKQVNQMNLPKIEEAGSSSPL